MKLLEGYVENRTKEAALAAVLGALLYVTRVIIRIPSVGGLSISISTVFLYLPALILSWPYSWMMPLIVTATSNFPVGSFMAGIAGSQMAYFSSRLLPRNGYTRVLPLVLSAYTATITGTIYLHLMGLIPFNMAFPHQMVQGTVTAILCVVLTSPLLKVFEIFGVIIDE